MDANEIINNAVKSGGTMIGGPDVFVLEGNVERNELRVLSADECLKNNVAAFAWGLQTGFIMLGMYSSKETAEEQIEAIRKLIRDEDGNNLIYVSPKDI